MSVMPKNLYHNKITMCAEKKSQIHEIAKKNRTSFPAVSRVFKQSKHVFAEK